MTPREILVQYLTLKVADEDWHGVADAAMDLRDLDAHARGHHEGVERGRYAAFREVEQMANCQKARA